MSCHCGSTDTYTDQPYIYNGNICINKCCGGCHDILGTSTSKLADAVATGDKLAERNAKRK